MRKRLSITAAILLTIAVTSVVTAASFSFIFNETPFSPDNYSWEEDWVIKEMIDFLEATLTIEGCGYQGQEHNVELLIQNIATVTDYYAVYFGYTANWYIDEANQEPIIIGAYSGALGVGETLIDTTTFQPSLIGAGLVKMKIFDIVWSTPELITWTTEVIDNTDGTIEVSNFIITGATTSLIESGTVGFGVANIGADQVTITYTLEVVELDQIIAIADKTVPTGGTAFPVSHDFNPLPSGGDLTMRLTVNYSA